jgi:hypothetical protein
MHRTLSKAAHPEQTLLQFLEVAFKMAFHVISVPFVRKLETRACGSTENHPKRPVM